MRSSNKAPLNGNLPYTQVVKVLESGLRQVNGVRVVTSWAIIRNGHGDRVAISYVNDLHLLPAKRRSIASIAIPILIYGRNQVGILMYLAASTGNSILIEKGSHASKIKITATVASCTRGRRRTGWSSRRGRSWLGSRGSGRDNFGLFKRARSRRRGWSWSFRRWGRGRRLR